MNKEQFLDELEKLLQDIDSIERDEALNYYRDYFEDAGSEHEQEVIWIRNTWKSCTNN